MAVFSPRRHQEAVLRRLREGALLPHLPRVMLVVALLHLLLQEMQVGALLLHLPQVLEVGLRRLHPVNNSTLLLVTLPLRRPPAVVCNN